MQKEEKGGKVDHTIKNPGEYARTRRMSEAVASRGGTPDVRKERIQEVWPHQHQRRKKD